MQSLSAIEFEPVDEEKSSAVHSTSVGENKDKKKKKRLSDFRHIKQNECLYYTEMALSSFP